MLQRIEYESIFTICFHCGIVGHRAENCVLNKMSGSAQGSVSGEKGGSVSGEVGKSVSGGGQSSAAPSNGQTLADKFGPWMLVPRKSGRGSFQKGKKVVNDNAGFSGKKWSVLSEDLGEDNQEGMEIIQECEDSQPADLEMQEARSQNRRKDRRDEVNASRVNKKSRQDESSRVLMEKDLPNLASKDNIQKSNVENGQRPKGESSKSSGLMPKKNIAFKAHAIKQKEND